MLLLIEDNPADAKLLRRQLGDSYVLEHVTTLQEGLSALQVKDYDAILLDLGLPDSNGLESLAALTERTHHPIVVLTGMAEEALGDAAIRQGAQDYLVKGQQDERSVARALRYATERHALEKRLRAALAREQHLKEIASLQELARSPATSASAQALVLGSLHENNPELFGELVERYSVVLEHALEQRAYKVEHDLGGALHAITETLGALRAGARDVIEIHTAALAQKHRTSGPARAQAYTEEGRLLLLELMGRLVAHYLPYALGRPTQRGGGKA